MCARASAHASALLVQPIERGLYVGIWDLFIPHDAPAR